jgi:hypothetical protein
MLRGCETPTEFSDSRIEAFVHQAGLPNPVGPFYFTRLDDHELQSFTIGFGEIVECPALLRYGGDNREQECRSGVAYGLRLGDRIGWLQLQNEGIVLAEDSNHFDVVGPEDAILNAQLWDDLEGRDPDFYHYHFKGRIVRDFDTHLPVLHRMADELLDWMWPPGGHLLLDNPVAVGDRSLVEKLAALPVFQGDPYAEVRARAELLLAQ